MNKTILATTAAVLLMGARLSHAALGTITTVASPPGPLNVNDFFTVSLTIAGYTEATEIDGYQFKVTYPSALFSFVGSFDHGTTSLGINQQWLAMPQQETDGSYTPTPGDNGTVPGTVTIELADLGFTAVERGTNSAAGFLVSFQMQAIAQGTGSFTPANTSPGSTVFFDVDFNPIAGSPAFVGASVTVVPEPATSLTSLAGVFLFAHRRRRGV